MVFGLMILRTIRAYLLFQIVDSFLMDEYKESYPTFKAMSTDYKSFINPEVQNEERYNMKNYEQMEKFWS